jgi:DNA polymerase I-like protein with 3'-5' exonuclease and polymerase domains
VYSQLPLFEPDSGWIAPRISDLPTTWGSGRVGIDCETRDELLTKLGPGVRRGAYIVGISFAIEDGPSFYLPIRHGGGGNMDPEAVLNYVRDCAARFDGILCGANLGYDLDFLAEEKIVFPNVKWFRDIQVADPLINELHFNYSMEAISERWSITGKDETLLREALSAYGYKDKTAKSGIWALPAKHVGPYGEQDARLPLAILRRQEREIEAQDLWGVYNLESRVLPVLVKMRRRGVAVSQDRLDQVERWSKEQQQLAIDAANQVLTGHRLGFHDITNTNVVARVLREIGIELPKTKTGKDSVTGAILDSIDHPVADHLRRAKKMSTLRSTFVDGVKHHLTNGRAHCTFNQLRRQKDDGSGDTEGAAFGRLSSANFNFQNQPARDEEIGPMWRSIYVPDFVEDGCQWAALDYSQQEPRQAVHSAIESGPKAIGQAAYESALEAARRYRDDPTMDFHQMMADMAGIKRKPAKNIFLGLSYGMGGAKLCRDLGLPTAWRLQWGQGRQRKSRDFETREECAAKANAGREAGYQVRFWEVAGKEGQTLTDTFDKRVPFVRRMAQYMQDTAEKQGYIETLSGRRCRFPKKDDGTFDWLHKAFNRRIQGGSADQTKMALVAMDDEGLYVQLQVHDEIDGSMTPEDARRGAEIMENVVQLSVPMKVDVEMGPSWGESM